MPSIQKNKYTLDIRSLLSTTQLNYEICILKSMAIIQRNRQKYDIYNKEETAIQLRQFAGEAFTVIWSMISLHCDLETN